ncbi:MAG: hypothetical protein A2W08_12195 [Candidatus Rokubacteria bacterium RBG_16_73_20]|nr:MAG: hypothetical protein A2W08_12195 [Candidatus Rokubacteria bacterium RBG_16_73_20]
MRSPPKRRPITRSMSRSAAPLGEVTIPIVRGNRGSARLRAGSNNPSAPSRALSCSNASWSAPSPRGSSSSTTSWYSPRCAYTSTLPKASTWSPSAGSKRRRRPRLRKSAQRSCASASLSVK